MTATEKSKATRHRFCATATRRVAVVTMLASWTLVGAVDASPGKGVSADRPPVASAEAEPASGNATTTGSTPAFTMAQTLSDGAQRTTIAFSGLAMMTGNLDAQSFFPPGKVADYTGFQYLRDNDPDNMGHNTSFLTRVANNVIYILNDAQFAQLKTLALAQLAQIDLYGFKRFPLMKAFRRLLDGDVPAGASGLDLDAVKQASRELYILDGQISFDRALLYANLIKSLDATQKAYLDAMKGKGWNSWPDITKSQIDTKMKGLPQGTSVAVMTYASDLFSWYAGSVEADVYFCPERHGTYYGGFYIKDAPAIGHEGYSIDEQLTATAGAALSDASKGYVTPAQAALMSSLVDTQRNNLYSSPTANIVQTRTDIATLLRSLLTTTGSTDAIRARVLELSAIYGELDGENNYAYATVFAQVYKTLSAAQKTKLAALRKSIMSGTYADGTPFDYSVCTTPYLYSGVITDQSLLTPYIADTDDLFAVGAGLTASFAFAPAAPLTGQAVTFTDTSTGDPTAWAWTFGDGATSTLQHPTHSYLAAGTYTVMLVAGSAAGSSTTGATLTVSAPVTPPTLSTVSPSSGPTAGGTTVTITGAGFAASATVTFGGTPATTVTVLGATSIKATTPAHAAAAVDVVVTSNGQAGVLAGGFTYMTGPTACGTFAKSTPTFLATNQPTSLTLNWTVSGPGCLYEYCVDNELTSNNTCDSRWVPAGAATSVVVPGLAFSTRYVWQVRASDGTPGATPVYANAPSTLKTGTWWPFLTARIPTVTVSTTNTLAGEAGPNPGRFAVKRTGDPSSELSVAVAVGGSADEAIDFTLSGVAGDATTRSVTVPVGRSGVLLTSVPVVVTPIDDALTEGDETVTLTILPGDGYVVGSPKLAKLTVVDDDLCPTGADLVVASLLGPTNAGASMDILVRDTTRNQSVVPAGPSTTRFSLSTDAAASQDDIVLGSRAVPELAGYASSMTVTSLMIPDGTQAGPYYLLARADADLAQCESAESNNVRSRLIYIGPDLMVSLVSVAGDGTVGGALAVQVETKNTGGAGTGPSVTRLYLSRNYNLDADDIPLGAVDVPGLASGQAFRVTQPMTIPATVEAGSWYLIAVADGDGAVLEARKTNNLGRTWITLW